MGKVAFDYEHHNSILKLKASFYSLKLWKRKFNGKIEFAKNFRGTHGVINFWGNNSPTIQINKKLSDPALEFSLDDVLVYLLTQWYCRGKNLNTEKDLLQELINHGICSKDKFCIHNNVAYTGSYEKRMWEPTIKLINLNLEYSI
jgi:hypothetical protein